jgi:murein DD-endopeptidase MepM/ murein hydrolase activator NlpD
LKQGLAALLLLAVSQTACALEPPRVQLKGDWKQGHLVFGRTEPGAEVTFKGRKLRVSQRGDFVLGLDRDEKGTVEVRARHPDGTEEQQQYDVATQAWQIQRIDGLPGDKVNPPAKVLERIGKEQAQIVAARRRDSEGEGFLQSWIWPTTGRVSGVFGSQRILNGEPKSPHYGVDVAVPTGTKLVAPADGVVSLAAKDFYYTGGTLMIDHGHGVSSIMVHLSKLLVKKGDKVKQGQAVALSGMTGRATGPHLHWGVSWFDSKVDAALLVPAMP